MTMRAPHFGPRAAANSRGSVLAVVAVAVTLSEGWINVLALPLDHARWLALGLHVLQSQATLIKRGSIAILLLLIAGSGIAFRNAERPMPTPQVKAATPATTAGSVAGAAAAALPERSEEILPPTPTIVAERPTPKPVPPPRRVQAKSHSRPGQPPEPEPPRRVPPRPLHPGEFGRKFISRL